MAEPARPRQRATTSAIVSGGSKANAKSPPRPPTVRAAAIEADAPVQRETSDAVDGVAVVSIAA